MLPYLSIRILKQPQSVEPSSEAYLKFVISGDVALAGVVDLVSDEVQSGIGRKHSTVRVLFEK